ncbi:uncharacterized protein LOC129752418 [Uranotaenia lowii]|uniref:uncharacterized protein LOC129752418 n=1 Tax=Uranotaenia lowii TaxID=190385 RepID=UPI00247B12B5|nr:uncharacterized protein LOC129752418 [Uranotaenia lowii]
MGACVYIRSIDSSGNLSSHLLCSKSKLAPIGNKRMTLPRQELCAALCLARLISNVSRAIPSSFAEIRAWTDSQVVLAWLNGGASRWTTFVANRVAEINTLLPSINWDHIDTKQNPADLVSRGASPQELHNNSLWWIGPEWSPLAGHLKSSPRITLDTDLRQMISREERKITICLITPHESTFLDELMSRYYPDLRMLSRVTARLRRIFVREFKVSTCLVPLETNQALQILIRHTQRKGFPNDLESLELGKELKNQSSLLQLKPFLDDDGIVRVGGRLNHSCLTYDEKHPILLPRSSILTAYILHSEHINNHHCGPQTLLAISRRRYWIICGTSAARKTYRQCVVCARSKPVPNSQMMGQLPQERVTPQPTFAVTGVDYAGPVCLVGRRARGVISSKGYIALFVCFSTKAVHLEAVSDLRNADVSCRLHKVFESIWPSHEDVLR